MSKDCFKLKIKNSKFKIINNQGQSMVEFALLLPVFLILVLGFIQFAIIINCYLSLTTMARQGVRYATINATDTTINDDAIKTYIRGNSGNGYHNGINPSFIYGGDISITISPAYGSPQRVRGSNISINLSYNLKGTRKRIIIPTNFLGLQIPTTVSAGASARIE